MRSSWWSYPCPSRAIESPCAASSKWQFARSVVCARKSISSLLYTSLLSMRISSSLGKFSCIVIVCTSLSAPCTFSHCTLKVWLFGCLSTTGTSWVARYSGLYAVSSTRHVTGWFASMVMVLVGFT